jgi:hypothetical protein
LWITVGNRDCHYLSQSVPWFDLAYVASRMPESFQGLIHENSPCYLLGVESQEKGGFTAVRSSVVAIAALLGGDGPRAQGAEPIR